MQLKERASPWAKFNKIMSLKSQKKNQWTKPKSQKVE